MTRRSNNYGRAYEYACIKALYESINEIRPATIIHNSCLDAAKRAWDNIPVTLQNTLKISASAATEILLNYESMILENNNDVVELFIQSDRAGEVGDVRDILIIRKEADWEVGLSIKHNNDAIKHSRLSKTIDFGEKWYGIPCSDEYWNKVNPIFDFLKVEHDRRTLWREIDNKFENIYLPVLNAFIDEVLDAYGKDASMLQRMIEYLLGEYDFYKIISMDREQITRIQAINIHGKLGLATQPEQETNSLPLTLLPTKIADIGIRDGCKTTIDLRLNDSWHFSFRIHSADEIVQSSLKFDIKLIGTPPTITTFDSPWI